MPRNSGGPPSPSIRSPNYSTIRGKLLDDRRLDYYILRGRYGEAARAALQAKLDAEKKKKKRKKSSWSKTKKLLGL